MTADRVTWFDPPARPVEGATIHVRPDPEAPMTDPDLTAAARIVAAFGDALVNATTFPYDCVGGVDWIAQSMVGEPNVDAQAVAAAVLAAARRELAVPEVACPSCGATIRARLMDQPGALTEETR